MRKYWISWVHDKKFGSIKTIFPMWRDGVYKNGNPIISAAVKAHGSIDLIKRVFPSLYDRQENGKSQNMIIVNFHEKPKDWSPFSDEYPKQEWMNYD